MRHAAAALAVAAALVVVVAIKVACAAPGAPRQPLPPPPRIFAFVSGLGGEELERVRSVGRRIDVLAPNWFAIHLRSGVVGGSHTHPLGDEARKRRIALWPVINARTGGSPVIWNSAWRERVARNVAARAREGRYAGMTLDVEELAPDQRPAFTALVQRVSARLHAQGRKLAVYVPRPFVNFGAAYDWPALAADADLLLASGYNEHARASTPGPIATSAGFEAVLQHAATVSRRRVAPTLGAFGYRWSTSGRPGELVSTTTAGRLRARCGRQTTRRDDGTVSFRCGRGVVFYESERGLLKRAHAARRAGFRWLALFSLGREPKGFWKEVATARRR